VVDVKSAASTPKTEKEFTRLMIQIINSRSSISAPKQSVLTMGELFRHFFLGRRSTAMFRVAREAPLLYRLAVIAVIWFRSIW